MVLTRQHGWDKEGERRAEGEAAQLLYTQHMLPRTQQEIALLNQLVTSKDGIIADLKARLGKYEKTVVIEGEEPYIVGPSKSLIESLCKEIYKLKQTLKESEADAAQRLETSKTVS